jgi:hypothetical protein
LKISKNSLIYRFTYKSWFTPTDRCVADDFCTYARQFMGSVLVAAFLTTLALGALTTAVAFVGVGFTIHGLPDFYDSIVLTALSAVGTLVWCGVGMTAIGAAVIFGIFGLNELWEKRILADGPNGNPSVIATYVHSVHRKVCPLVEFEDD